MGLERTFYEVSEDVGVVEVCGLVYSSEIECPIAFAFNVTLKAMYGCAGKCRAKTIAYTYT